MQGFTLAAITDAEKIKLRHKNEQSQWTVKYRSRALGQGACLKGIMSRAITMQCFTLLALTDVEKCQGACLKGMSRAITMQGFMLLALTDVEKTRL